MNTNDEAAQQLLSVATTAAKQQRPGFWALLFQRLQERHEERERRKSIRRCQAGKHEWLCWVYSHNSKTHDRTDPNLIIKRSAVYISYCENCGLPKSHSITTTG